MKKFVVIFLSIIALLFFSCDIWMSNDNIFEEIEDEVKVANAQKIDVYVRYAMTRQGTTTPNGKSTFKVGIPHEISARTEPEYGFKRWAAFPNGYINDDQSKNKDIYFIDDENYNTNILPKELKSGEVVFENADEPNTIVTINKKLDKINLVPIIAQRPSVGISIPAKGSSGVVKNMSVRINFTKPMDPESFKNEQGEFDKITITQGIQTYTSDGDIELNSEDITDHFEFNDAMFSSNKKMITLKFKQDYISEGYASQSSVSILIAKEVKDIYGYAMTDDSEISFTVGSKKDSLAPRITRLTAGIGTNFEAFQGVYKDVGTIDNLGQKTRMTLEGASLVPTDDIEDSFFDNFVSNRIGSNSKLVLRIYAEDLAGSGSSQSLDGIEADVARIGIRAKHLYNSDGTQDKTAQMSDITYMVYTTGQNNTSLNGSYRELVNKANETLPEGVEALDSSYGSLFEYDLSNMPDGLIQVDVAAVDLVQNIGFFEGGSNSSEYGNGYTSLFIVKDTTAPDAEANKEYVQADLSIVPNGRGMFNAEYYKKLAVIESNAGAIKDKGNHRLVAPNSELKWIVNPGSDTTWIKSITADNAKWKLVSEGYKPAESSLPGVDGPVDFTYALMDNLGNISDAVIFNSITYDNTIPTLDALKIQGINGYISTSITGNVLENQILYIPVYDETAGLESIEISTSCIKDETTYPEYDKPFASGSLVVKVDDVPVKYTIDGKKLTLENTIIGNSTVAIQGLQIADADNIIDDSTYRISVSVTDAALNTSVINTCDIKNDSTAPVINYVRVKNINSGIVGDSAEEYWTTEVEPNTALYINLTETNTGAKVFDFAGSSIKLTRDSELIWNEETLPIEIDTTANKLTVTDEYKTVITEATGGEVIISNVELTEENRVVLAISDLVTNTSEKKSNFTLTDNRTIDLFKYDGETPRVKAVVLKDQAPGTGGAAEAGYTDNEYVEATVSVEATASGVYKLTITGASFDSTTLVNGKQSTDATEGFEISDEGRTITLRTNGNKVNRILKGTFDIKLGNVKLPANDGDKDVSFTVTSVANRTSAETTDAQTSIRLDKTAPAWYKEGVYVAETNASRKASIYPHVSTSEAGNVKIGGTVYFYTKDVINVAADITETNRKDKNVDLFIDSATTPVAEYKDVAPGKHSVYAVDKAGNKSAEKIFYVVGDTEGPAAFDGYVTFTMPDDGNIYRGNAPTENASGTVTQNYVIKQSAKPYQIIVKLGGVTEKDIDVHGVARKALNRFTELEPQIDKSLVEYYAFSTDGKQNWQPIGNGQITISLPLTGDCTPYTVYLKDGCGNITPYTVPVNWKVDGSIVPGGKDLSYSSLYVNKAEDKRITYYKGDTTPVFSLTSYNDTCFYPNDTVEAGINKSTEKYTLKSRILAWPNDSTVPSRADFYSTTIEASRFSPWSYLTLKTPTDSFAMTHNYPKYDVTTAYKLYYIVEDKLGNYTITQLKNETDGTELWMYDNTPPSITVEAGARINTMNDADNVLTNYYSDVSTLSLNMTDTQSGIEWDGSKHYKGSDVKNTLKAIEYSLANLDPRSDFSFKINGIMDYVQNVMPDTEGLKVKSTDKWVKQTAPKLPDTESATIIGWDGTANGTSNYTSKLTSEADGSKKIAVKSPRSVTSLKFGFKVNSCDTADLLGWIIRTEPLTSFDSFYSMDRVGTGEGKDITELTRNEDDKYEYIYNKKDTTQKWEEIDNKIQYFYAINRAGLICQDPIIVEFVENPIPVVSNLEYKDVKTLENVNYIKESSTIKFVTRKDIPEDDVTQNETVEITKCEFYIGSSTTAALTKDFTAAPVTEFTLTAAEAAVLPKLSNDELTVKLYTATEQSEKYELTDADQGLATSNIWMYDGIAPVINSIKVLNINSAIEGTKAEEYWTTETTPQTALYINLTEVNTGAKIFDFAGSTVKLREDTVLTWNRENLPIEIDTEANKLTITDDTKTVKTAASGGQVVISNFDLDQTATGNSIKLVISDYVINPSAQKSNFVLEDNTNITLFKYDGDTPVVTSVILSDRAIGEGGYAETGYTNEEYINASIKVTATISGVYKITVDGAEFDSTTTVNGKSAGDDSEGFKITNKNTITLRTSRNTENRILRGTPTITIENVKLPSGDGDKNVSFTVTSLANRTSAVTDKAKASIRLDKTAPVWVGDGIFVGEGNSTETIYPHTSTSASGNIKIGGTIYFYTKNTINLAANVSDTNRKDNNKDLCMDVTTINNSTNLVIKFDEVAPDSHTIYAVDKAGNRSAAKTFYVVKDITGLENFEGYVTFAMPTGGDIYRGNADTSSTKNYVIKQNANPYQIIVKLPGVTAADNDVHGKTRAPLGRFAELDPQATKAPIEYYAFSTDGSKDWQPIGNGVITINLPTEDKATAAPYTVYLKDGCSNESEYKVPVNWLVDGSVTLGGEDLSYSSLYVNAAEGKKITYYKGDTTPVLSLTSFNDTCYYPSASASVASNTEPADKAYTLKSRVLAWTNNDTTPTKSDFYSTSIEEARLTPWSYLTLKAATDSVAMTHNYPKYDVTTAFKLYYIVEDKLGNFTITQLKNTTDGTELWMYDNTPPSITVETAGKVNTVSVKEGTDTVDYNYYSDVSTLSLTIADTQSGIKWDGSTEYSGADVKNDLTGITYSLNGINPDNERKLKIHGLKDYVENIMPDTDGLAYNSKNLWKKQTTPSLAATNPVRVYSKVGEVNGTVTDGYTFETKTEATTASTPDGQKIYGQKIEVKAPRSITSMTFAFKLAVSSSTVTVDNEDLLGWIIKNEPISSFADWYSESNTEINKTDVTRNTANTAENEYFYTYTKSEDAQWEDNATKLRYFYAVNRAGLICKTPVIVEFKANPVPVIETRTYNEVETFENINYLKADSTITFTTNVPVTKIEFYKDGNLVLTKPDANTTNFPVSSYTLTNSEILSTLTENALTVKLFTATEESAQYVLTDSSHASSNKWTYDDVKPEIKEIKVEGLKKGTTDGTTFEYWATDNVNKTDVYITLKEAKTGVRVFDFTDSTIKLTSSSKLYNISDNEEITSITVDTTNNKLTIGAYNQAVRNESGNDVIVKITDVELVPATSTTTTRPDNKINLKLYDIAVNESAAGNKFKFDTTEIDGFNYDPSNPVVSSVTLADRAPVMVQTRTGDFAIPVNSEYTNEQYVKVTVVITATESGVSQLTVDGADFVSSIEDSTNATTITIGGNDVPFTISDSKKTITFDNNRVFKGSFTVVINNLLLPEYDNTVNDDTKTVSITAINLGEKVSSSTQDSIILDMTPPAWNNTGLYTYSVRYKHTAVNVSEDKFKTIYPHPSVNTEKVYGFVPEVTANPDGDIYFYTTGTTVCVEPDVTEKHLGSGNSNVLYMYFETIEGKLEQDTFCFPTDPFEFLGLTPIAADSKITTYVIDKAGNKSTTKTFHIVKDENGPSSIEDYITFVKAMDGDTPVGQVLRSSTTEYNIKKLEGNVEPYKIVIKLGSTSGVSETDETIDGTSYDTITRPEYAYTELYETSADVVNTAHYDVTKSPIEYFAVTIGSESAPDDPAEWIGIMDSNNVSVNPTTVNGGGTITISLPKNGTCSPITVHLKDSCGNITSTPTNINWIIDEEIGEGNYSINFKNNTYDATYEDTSKTKAHVVIDNPYDSSVSTSGGMAINNGVTYYNSTGTPKLILNYEDTCYWPTGTTVSDTVYSLRGRLIAWTETEAPSYSDFINETGTNRKWAQPWKPVITHTANELVSIEFDLPGETDADLVNAVDENGNPIPYQLWYVVEDAVANNKIMQVKNRATSTSADVKDWMFDNTPPVVTITDSSFEKVNTNTTDSKNYYSVNSTVTYRIEDPKSGVSEPNKSNLYTPTYNIADFTFASNKYSVAGIRDIVGNLAASQDLTKGSINTWEKQTIANLDDAISNKAGSVYFENSNSHEVTGDNRVYNSSNTASSPASYLYNIKMKTRHSYVKITMPSDNSLLGWIVRTDDNWNTLETANTQFYDSVDLDNGETYKLDKVAENDGSWKADKRYFYAVNKAGLICAKPIEVRIVSNIIPIIKAGTNISYNNIVTNDSINFIKTGNYINETTTSVVNPSSISFTSNTDLSTCTFECAEQNIKEEFTTSGTSHSFTLTQDTWKNLSNGEIVLTLSTTTEDSAPITLQFGDINKWTYDATRPEITMSLKDSDDNTAAILTGDTYYIKSKTNSKVKFNFTTSDSDIDHYEYKKPSTEWATLASPYQLPVSSTVETYSIRAVDKAGNPSATETVKVKQDITGPVGEYTNITKTFSGDDTSKNWESTVSSKANTVYYNPEKINSVVLSVSISGTKAITDAGVGFASKYLYYKLNGGSEQEVTGSSITVTLSANEEKTYEIIAKDALGNATTLHTFTFNGKAPTGTSTYSSDANTSIVSKDSGIPIIYYNDAKVSSIQLSVTGTDASGSSDSTYVSIYSLKDDETAHNSNASSVSSRKLTITPVANASYKVYVEDRIGNKTLLKTYKFGTIGYIPKLDNATASSGYRDDGTASAPEIYYNKNSVNKLAIVPNGVKDITETSYLPSELYYRTVSGSLSDDNKTKTIPLTVSGNAINTTYEIVAKDGDVVSVLKTFKINGSAPTGGTISFDSSNNASKTHEVTDGSGSIIYLNWEDISNIVFKKESNVVDAAGKAVSLYLDSVNNTEISVGNDGTFTVNKGENKTSEHCIIAKDELGNTAELKRFTFNGEGPSATVSHSLKNGSNAAETSYYDDETGSYENGLYVYYNKSYVKTLEGSVSVDESCYNVSLTTNPSGNISNGNFSFTLPQSSELTATYKVIATDGVGNTKEIAVFYVDGSAPGGTITPRTVDGSTYYDTTNTTLYYNSALTKLTFDVSGLKDAQNKDVDLYLDSATDAFINTKDITSNSFELTLDPIPFTGSHTITAKDKLSNTTDFAFTFSCDAPSGTISYNQESGKTIKVSDASTQTDTVYFNNNTVSSITFVKGNDVKDARGQDVDLYLNDATDENNKFGNSLTLSCVAETSTTYEIYAKDTLGNIAKLKTFVLDGRLPSGTISYEAEEGKTEVVSDASTLKDNVYFKNGAISSITFVKGNDVKDARGQTVDLYLNDATDEDNKFGNDLTLSCVANTSTTYEIYAKDILGNIARLKTFVLDGTLPTGAVTYTDETNTKLITSNGTNTIYFNSSSVTQVTLVEDSNNPIKAAGNRTANLYYQIGEGALTAISNFKLTCPTNSTKTATYDIYAVDGLGNKKKLETYTLNGSVPTGSISIGQNYVGKTTGTGESATFTAVSAATDTTAGGYILTSDNTENTTTIKYNPSLVNTVKLNPTVADSGVGSKVRVMNGTTKVSETTYSSGVVIPVTLSSSWTSDFTTYDVKAVDNVGNTTTLWTYKFKAYTTAPVAQTRTNDINYGNFDGNKIKWKYTTEEVEVKGLKGHSITSGTVEHIKDTGGDHIIVNGDVHFSIPLTNVSALISDKVSYRITSIGNGAESYEGWSTSVTTDWQTLQTITDNKINVKIGTADVAAFQSFVFIWIKDAIGNMNVYNLVYPNDSKTWGWFSPDNYTPVGNIECTPQKNSSNASESDCIVSNNKADFTYENGVGTTETTLIYNNADKVDAIKFTITETGEKKDSLPNKWIPLATSPLSFKNGETTLTATNNIVSLSGVNRSNGIDVFATDKLGKTTKVLHVAFETDTTGPTGESIEKTLIRNYNTVDGKFYKLESQNNDKKFIFSYNSGEVDSIKLKVNATDPVGLKTGNKSQWDSTQVGKIYFGTKEFNVNEDKTFSISGNNSDFTITENTSINITAKDKLGNESTLYTIEFRPIANYLDGTVTFTFKKETTDGETTTESVADSKYYQVTPELDSNGKLEIATDAQITYKPSEVTKVILTPTIANETITSMYYKKDNAESTTDMTNNTLPLSAGTFEVYAKYKDTNNGWTEYPLKLFTLTITANESFVVENPDNNSNIWSFIRQFGGITETAPTNINQYDGTFNNSGLGSNAFEQVNDFVDYSRKARKAKKAAKSKKSAKKAVEIVMPEVVTAQNQHTEAANKAVEEVLPETVVSLVDEVTSASVISPVDAIVTEAPVVTEEAITAVETLAETVAETSVPEQVITPVEAVIKSEQKVAENNVIAANTTIIQPQSNNYEEEVVDLKLIYVVIAILLAAVAVVAVIVITKKQKAK